MTEITSEWAYLRLIPQRFQRKTGVDKHHFAVRDPWPEPYQYVLTARNTAREIRPAAYCALLAESGIKHLLIDLACHPVLGNAVLYLGKLLFTKNRVEKYLFLYRAYESITPTHKVDYAAVRHALVHAGEVLSRRRTLEALDRLFGGRHIDFANSRHVRSFYEVFGAMLLENDSLLAQRLAQNASAFMEIDSRDRTLMALRLEGVPGLWEPVPLDTSD